MLYFVCYIVLRNYYRPTLAASTCGYRCSLPPGRLRRRCLRPRGYPTGSGRPDGTRGSHPHSTPRVRYRVRRDSIRIILLLRPGDTEPNQVVDLSPVAFVHQLQELTPATQLFSDGSFQYLQLDTSSGLPYLYQGWVARMLCLFGPIEKSCLPGAAYLLQADRKEPSHESPPESRVVIVPAGLRRVGTGMYSGE